MANHHDKILRNQRWQTTMAAANVAQTAKTNRHLNDLKAQSAEQAKIQRENVEINRGILYTNQVGNQIAQKQIQVAQAEGRLTREELRKIDRSVREVAQLQQTMNRHLSGIDKTNREILIENKKQNILIMADSEREKFQFALLQNEKKLEKLEEQKLKNMHEVLFQVSEDLVDIPNSPKHKIEIFFQLESLLANCKDAGIATDQVLDLDLKKKIDDTYKNIESEINDCLTKLSDEENEDLGDILDILIEDEESLIAIEGVVIEKNKRARDVAINEINAANTSINKLKKEITKLEEAVAQNS